MRIVSILTLCLLLLAVFSNKTFAEETGNETKSLPSQLWHYLTDEASVSIGIGGRQIAIDVTRIGTNDHGRMINNSDDAYFLSYNTKASYFKNSNFGYSWLFNFSTFHLTEQELQNGKIVDYGSQVSGLFAYVVPTFFYNWGDKYRGLYVRPGIGLGIGAAEFSGEVVLTESSRGVDDRVQISNGDSEFFLALGIFMDFQWNYFTIRLATGGPNIQNSGLDMNISDSSFMIGLSYFLD